MGESEIVAVTVTLTREDYAAALRVLNEPSSWPKTDALLAKRGHPRLLLL